MQRLYENLFYSKAVNELFTDEAFVKQMLRFEAALAKAQASQALIPVDAAQIIETFCTIDNINLEFLIEQTGLGGNPNIPLIKQLTKVVASNHPEAAKYIHFGATSQDVIDTAIILQIKEAIKIIIDDLNQLIKQLVELTKSHKHSLMMGRTLGQHARPITFGFKVARWLDSLLRSRKQMSDLSQHLVVQLGGPVGTIEGMDDKGMKTVEALANILELQVPTISWHAQRDRLVTIATTLGILQGNLGKMAEDIVLLMQTEINEVRERFVEGKGGSSSMPHKRNPVGSLAITANAKRVPGLVATMLQCMTGEHERATGSWHAEWETMTFIVKLVAGSVRQAAVITSDLEVDTKRMLQNLESTNGPVSPDSFEDLCKSIEVYLKRVLNVV